jgi:hypothetical protein
MSDNLEKKANIVLDATCGGRMMWFDKDNPLAMFIDNRILPATKLSNRATLEVRPDIVMDYTHLEFDNDTFYLTIFDPPHLKNNAGSNSYMVKKYGKLPKDWQENLRAGFNECWRVTKPYGTIVFKWNETQISTAAVIAAIGKQPLFGHTTNNKGTTKWMCFIKAEASK